MISRRNAILAGAGILTAPHNISIAGPDSLPVPANAPSAILSPDYIAESCRRCAKACSDTLIASGISQSELKRSVRDCRDICDAAAKLLDRNGPMVPAITQACADACSRLAERIKSVNACVPQLRQAADECRRACDSVFVASKQHI